MRYDSLLRCALVTLLSTSSAWASVEPEDGLQHPAGREFVRLVRRATGAPSDEVKRTPGDEVYGNCLQDFMALDTLVLLSDMDGAAKKDPRAEIPRYAAAERGCVEAAHKQTKTLPALRLEPATLQDTSYLFAIDNAGVFDQAKTRLNQKLSHSTRQVDTRPLGPVDRIVRSVKNGVGHIFGGGGGGGRR